MTEAWKSNKMHWCDVCKCWLNDSKAAIQHHEQGMGHKANLARKIRDMGKKADEEKREKDRTVSALERIEKEAAARFEADKAAAQAAEKAAAEANGRWVWDADSSYYYNEKHRWYYDPKTKWYYGGEPSPQWAEHAPIPAGARFGVAPHEGGPVPQPAAPQTAGVIAGGAVVQKTQTVTVALPAHPLRGVGGAQAPSGLGRVGAAKGIALTSAPGTSAPKPTSAAAGGGAGDKRKREEDKGLSAEELEARAKREAARARVAARNAASYGYI